MCKQLEISMAAYYKCLSHKVQQESDKVTIAKNKLCRDFYESALNQKWSTDVTEFKIPGKKRSCI